MSDEFPIFGNRQEWKAFAERNPVFLERFSNLKRVLTTAFIRTLENSPKLETMLFFTARQSVDDFMEILLVCGNAEGNAAEKLLRSFYEKVVTVSYLHQFPENIDAYFEYYYVTSRKLIEAARRSGITELYTPERTQEIEDGYERVKENYRSRSCKECGRKEMSPAWSPVSLVDMAYKVGLGQYAFYAYNMPLLQAHPSVKGTLGRLDGKPDGPIEWGERIDRGKADRVLVTAHLLLLHLIDVQTQRFGVDGLKEQLQAAMKDWEDIWKPPGVDAPGNVD